MQFIHLAMPMHLDCEFDNLRIASNDIFDRARKDIYSPHCNHVIRTAEDASQESHPTAAASTVIAREHAEIASPIPDQWHTCATEIREHQLALLADVDRTQC